MKKICITLCAISIILITLFIGVFGGNDGNATGSSSDSDRNVFSGLFEGENKNDRAEYLRIHVRANSNDAVDQAVKYKVKDEIVALLTPAAATSKSKEELMRKLKGLLGEIEKTADGILKENGFSYTSRAALTEEEFPERKYGDLTLEKGYYDALILKLGRGKGDNWWCVVYPPLCFLGEGNGNIKYKSLILEIIEKWRARKRASGTQNK